MTTETQTTQTTRAELIELILVNAEPLTDATRFRAWLETLPEFQLREWAEALTD